MEKGTGLVDVGVPSLNIQRNGNSQSQRKYLVSQLYVWFQLTLLFRESCDGGQLSWVSNFFCSKPNDSAVRITFLTSNQKIIRRRNVKILDTGSGNGDGCKFHE